MALLSIVNTFYREHIPQRTHSIEHECSTMAQITVMVLLSIENTFYREHILQRTHSTEDAFYGNRSFTMAQSLPW